MNSKRKSQNRISKSTRLPRSRTSSTPRSAVTGQVRIIGGMFRRQYVPFIDAEGLRPSPDRLRETLFNWIQFDIHDANVLDLCAGSGVLGFEALSRGAKWVDFIELQPNQGRLIEQTADKLKLSKQQYQVTVGDVLKVLPTISLKYHIVFIDPPYDLDLWVPILNLLMKQNLINSDTIIYIEDNKPLNQTLSVLANNYAVIKTTKVGQINASLINIDFD